MRPQKHFEDFAVGETWESPPRTITDAHFLFFSALTGDDHPIHGDHVTAAQHPFGRRVTHGLLLASLTAMGGSELSTDVATTVIAFLEQRTRFLKPVFVGDSVKPVFEVIACEPKSGGRGLVRIRVAVLDEAGEAVLEGEHAYLIKSRPA
jgi:3-hydroxybutyryl-CoA dehydratase